MEPDHPNLARLREMRRLAAEVRSTRVPNPGALSAEEAACAAKVRHASHGAALREMRKAHVSPSNDAYRCAVCGGWHTGRRGRPGWGRLR